MSKGRVFIAWSTSLLCFAGKLERIAPQASGPAQSNPMCLLDFPVRSQLKPKASALSAVDVPHGDAKMELFDYIEVFYNQRRRHSTLGQIADDICQGTRVSIIVVP